MDYFPFKLIAFLPIFKNPSFLAARTILMLNDKVHGETSA